MKQTGQTRLYFAYGLNLNLVQMRQKCSKPHVLGIARLPGYRLGFYEYSVVWDGAMETIVPDPEAEVWGVLYRLTAADWEQLDNCEDARLDGTGAYFHYPVEVIDTEQSVTPATIYLKARWGQPECPSTEYLSVLVAGATEQGLPADYVAELQRIPTKPASYAVPRRPKCRRATSAGGCSDCGSC